MNSITVITSCKNRENFLKNNIEEISKINLLKEHLIIDFDSINKIKKENYKYDKLKILNVINEPKWSISRSYNTGIYFSTTEYTMKVDADVIIDSIQFNKINLEKYDILYLIENERDRGTFIAKTKILRKVNGFNEFIKSRFDDNDLLKRLQQEGFKVGEQKGLIKEKTEHPNEIRYSSNDNYFKSKSNEKFSYGIVKAHNDVGAYISSLNLWNSNNKLAYEKLNDNLIKINHSDYYEKLDSLRKFKLKYIFINTFFKIFYSDKNNLYFSILKRFIPIVMLLLPSKINNNIIGVDVGS